MADAGIGLSRREAKKVLDRFYQVDQSLSRRTGGCGLGLSIVKFIVTQRSVDRCVNTLRAKIEPCPGRPRFICTVREIGYRFETP